MVMKLKTATPVKFYGNALPRPRIYSDVKFNDHRVDPPVPVLDPLLSWANEAHWSMGGLSFKRLRLQGRIEGNVGRLRAQRERVEKQKQKLSNCSNGSGPTGSRSKRAASDSPPPAPIATKRRRRLLDLIDEDDEIDGDGFDLNEEGLDLDVKVVKGKRLVKKLADEFDKVANEGDRANGGGSEGVATRSRSQKSDGIAAAGTVLKVVAEKVNKSSFKGKNLKDKMSGKENKQKSASGNVNGGTRTSPRLANRS